MSHDLPRRVPDPAAASQQPPQRPRPAAEPPELPHLRFGLRHAFWFVTVLGLLLAGMAAVGGVTSLVLLLAAVVVAVHVAGTVLGNRLQTHADQYRAWRAEQKTDEAGPSGRR